MAFGHSQLAQEAAEQPAQAEAPAERDTVSPASSLDKKAQADIRRLMLSPPQPSHLRGCFLLMTSDSKRRPH